MSASLYLLRTVLSLQTADQDLCVQLIYIHIHYIVYFLDLFINKVTVLFIILYLCLDAKVVTLHFKKIFR